MRLVLLICLCSSLCSLTLAAQEHELRYSEMWTGVHLGGSVLGGPAFIGNSAVEDSGGWALGVELTSALVMQIFSLRINYLHSNFAATAEQSPLDFRSNSVGASIGLHPFFLAALFGPPLGYILASPYFLIGASADFTHLAWRDVELDESWLFGWHMGAGLDVPIDSPDDGGAFWAGFRWQRSFVPTTFEALGGDEKISVDAFLFSIAYRTNGLPL